MPDNPLANGRAWLVAQFARNRNQFRERAEHYWFQAIIIRQSQWNSQNFKISFPPLLLFVGIIIVNIIKGHLSIWLL